MCTLRFLVSWRLQTAFDLRNSRCSVSRNVYRYTAVSLSLSFPFEQCFMPYIGILRGALSRVRFLFLRLRKSDCYNGIVQEALMTRGDRELDSA